MDSKRLRYVCIHGHFYQPPRENPWLEEIEIQESAHPWHDWNQRITEECYTPNIQARVLDEKGQLADIINNYQHISFDFGPTLLRWMEERFPETYHAILEADTLSQQQRSGHGNAIAQAYHHIIMPLASRRDKITEVVWGIEDFSSRFRRDPEGMWLPETAVDIETLDVLAQHGIKFTILSPHQARRIKSLRTRDYVDVSQGAIDPTRPYLVNLRGGRSITIFFYEGPVSQAIAFEALLNSGESFKNRILAGFSDTRSWPQLMHIATDGESYGHHHRFGEMALAYTLRCLGQEPGVKLTNYGEYLEKHPPSVEVDLLAKSSWSCAHGVGRWSEDCGCRLEQRPGWDQKWRAPLRAAMNLLRDRVDDIFDREGSSVFIDPWAARDAYVKVVLARHRNVCDFVAERRADNLGDDDRTPALNLMEMQRNRLCIYTSCGWFFDDISGIEALQVLRYAARVLQLASPFDPALETDFLAKLSAAKSNRRGRQTGDELFRHRIKPQVADLAKVAAHVTTYSVFEDNHSQGPFFCYDVRLHDSARAELGERLLVVRRMSVQSAVTTEHRQFVVAMVYFGGVDIRCSVKQFDGIDWYMEMKKSLLDCAARRSSTELIRKMDHYFPGNYFSLHDLFIEHRARVILSVTRRMYEDQALMFETCYKKNKDFARLIIDEEAPVPDTFLAAARFVLNRTFLNELEKLAGGSFPDELQGVLEEARLWKIDLDTSEAEKLIRSRLLDLVSQLEQRPRDETIPEEIIKFLNLCAHLELPVTPGEAQIVFFRTIRSIVSEDGAELPPLFPALAQRLAVRLDGE